MKEIEKLAAKLSNYNVQVIFSGRQDNHDSTCGDMCLIMLQESLENLLLEIKLRTYNEIFDCIGIVSFYNK